MVGWETWSFNAEDTKKRIEGEAIIVRQVGLGNTQKVAPAGPQVPHLEPWTTAEHVGNREGVEGRDTLSADQFGWRRG